MAVALRNRYRRLQLEENMQQDITPKNLLMIGPTGVGKLRLLVVSQNCQCAFCKS